MEDSWFSRKRRDAFVTVKPRPEIFALRFKLTLFQFELREPQLTPLFQLLPKIGRGVITDQPNLFIFLNKFLILFWLSETPPRNTRRKIQAHIKPNRTTRTTSNPTTPRTAKKRTGYFRIFLTTYIFVISIVSI